jgi:asparagine synthase (glutamine-hydrolysing)
MDQPTFDGINTFVVSRAAAEAGFKVALSGVGSDELFGGYPSFRAVPRLAAARRILGRAGGPAAAALALGLPVGERRKKLRRWLGAVGIEGDAYDLMRELFARAERERLLGKTPKRVAEAGIGDGRLTFGDVSRRELTEYMRNVLLRDADCLGMACSLEIREPYLHLPLVELVLDLPDSWKHRQPAKSLLRDAVGDRLPRSILRRPKRGFLLPFEVWLRKGPLRAEVERILVWSNSDVLDPATVRNVWAEFQAGVTSWNRVWALYVLEKWTEENLRA